MNLERIRLSLALGYVGIFALIFLLLGTLAVVAFLSELTRQQDILLTQEARNQASNLLSGESREVLASGSDEYGWITLELDGGVTDSDSAASSLGLPDSELAQEALREDDVVSATIQGSGGNVRVVSLPMYEAGEVVGVIQYAQSLRQVREAVTEIVLILFPLGFGALGLAAFGGLYMARRAVRPMRESFERQRAFIADASHELKTPLTLIRADTEVLHRGLKDPEDRELANDVLAETDRMNSLLSDLLLVARLDAGQLAISREVLNLAAVIGNLCARFKTRADSEGVRLEARTAGEILALGDRARTEQILTVLLDNALKHTPKEGSVVVTGRTRGDFVEATVEDTGPGIPPKHLPRIFDRFYRVDASRSRAAGGSGLGLTIARDLARAQRGDLKAYNAKDGGAIFHLALPKG